MPDAFPDKVSVERLPVDLAVGGLQPREVQVETASTAVTDLHRREMPPAFVLKQCECMVVSRLAVDLDQSCVVRAHEAKTGEVSGSNSGSVLAGRLRGGTGRCRSISRQIGIRIASYAAGLYFRWIARSTPLPLAS